MQAVRLVFFSWLLTIPAMASAQVTADPNIVAQTMTQARYPAQIDNNINGDPFLRSAVKNTSFLVYFHGCEAGVNCKTVQFSAGFSRAGRDISFETMNDWNSKRRFGRAFLDSVGDPNIQMDIDLEDGGITPLLFIDNLEYWTLTMQEFIAFIYAQ